MTRFTHESRVLAAQFKFFAYLTFDRNYVCSKKIKDIFPIDTLLTYIQKDIASEIKAGLINIFTHAYLNERPRFHRKMQKVFPIYGIRRKEEFKDSLLSRANLKQSSKKRSYEYELKEMESKGLSKAAISNIFSFV